MEGEGWRNEGRYNKVVDQVAGAVWKHLLSSPALDSCSLGRAMQHTSPVAQTISYSSNLLCYHEEQREAADFSD